MNFIRFYQTQLPTESLFILFAAAEKAAQKTITALGPHLITAFAI
ncbi:hypothetical protein Cabys_1212 [Caldithrix abyssi DSM 13497]|uniref:Uncharacterized protein n=1 Tax=Caldithrix abyssi DSM 13497 TaxID=880073 RepID=A0A1J1C6P2_CALAY|nr:hypothetical protein Cabys_1212 [Caldithrix abyssi DSM 13497]